MDLSVYIRDLLLALERLVNDLRQELAAEGDRRQVRHECEMEAWEKESGNDDQ